MATFLDILLLAALIVTTTGNLISNFKGKKDNLFGKAAFPLLMLLIPAFYGTLVTQDSEPLEQSPETIYKTSTKSIGVAALKKAQSESKMLKSQEQSIDKVSSSIESVSQSMDASSKEEERQSSVKASEQVSIAASASKEEASRQASLSQQASSGNQDTSSADQVVTDESPKIIGNINTKVYHTPDQAGYRMNAANATYFDNESQAIANGYRKSKR